MQLNEFMIPVAAVSSDKTVIINHTSQSNHKELTVIDVAGDEWFLYSLDI